MSVNGAGRTASSTDPASSSVHSAMATTSTQRNKKKFKKIDHYVLMQTLGAGTFAKVKLGMDERTKDYYAVKVIDKAHVRKNFMSDHVQKEIDSMRRLEHPNIVRLLKVFSTSKKVFLVMEFVNSGELYTEVVNRGRLIEPYARFYFKQLIEGLQHCHDHKVFHRDLKLDNLLLEKDGTLKIADFGLSTFLSAPDGEEGLLLSRDMMLYTQVGTPAYVAPEIIMCDAEGYIGAKVDAWASGIVLYALCAGCLPFDGETENDTFKLILRCDINFPHFFSNDLIDLISNLLKTDPKDRYSLADVKAHPWCQGPVVTSQEDHIEEGDPGNAEEWEPTQASLKGFGSACRFSTARSDGIDSLDLGMRAESAETLLSGFSQVPTGSASKGASSTHRSTDMVPEPPSFDNDEFSPTSRRNSSREAWRHSVADKMQTLSQCEQQISETEPGIGGSLYAAHLRSCLGEDGLESNATHSSEEDHESEIEDAQECAVSKGFYGKHRKSYDDDGTSTDVRKWMRRSLSALDVPWTNSRVKGKYPPRTSQKNVAMKAHQRSNVRQKFRRELWENVSESLGGTQFKQLNERVEGLARGSVNEKSGFGKQRTADPGVHKTMTNLSNECIGPDNLADLSFGGMSEPTTPTSPGIVRNRRFDKGTLSEGKSKEVSVGAFVKSASFDGFSQNKSPRRRPRAVARSQVLQLGGDHPSASNEFSADNLSSPAAPATDSVMKKKRERLTKKNRSLANTSTVRFAEPLNRHDKNTKGSSHRERAVNTHWVKSVKDKQSWCKLMRDFEMIPDQEEFGKDSASLSVMWMKSLEAEDLAGPSVDSRFGPSEFALPRSYLEQPTLVRRSQVRQWRSQEARTALPIAESKGSPVLVKLDSSSAGTCIHADGNSDVLTVFKLNQGDCDSISMDLPDSSPEHHGDDRNYYNTLKLSEHRPSNVILTESVSPQLPPLVNTFRDQASGMLPDENSAIVNASNVDVAIDSSLGTTGIIDGPHLLSLLPAAEPTFRSSPKPHKVAFVEDSVLEQYMDTVPSTPPRRCSAQAWNSNGTNGKLSNPVQSQLGLSADNGTMSKTSTQIISDSGSKPGVPAKPAGFPHEAGLVRQEQVVLVESNVSRSTTSLEQAAVHRVFDVEIGRPEQRIRLPDSTPFHYVWKPLKPFVQTASEVICSLSPFVQWENETEFRTLARPPRCHEKILEVLRTLGCTVMRNKQRDLKQKFTVYASRAVEESKIVITIRISQLDKILTSVSVKRKSGDKAQFKKLYSDLLRLYDRFVKIREDT